MLPGITPAHVLAAAGVAPGNDAFVQMLLHFEQPNGQLIVNDSSQNQATGVFSAAGVVPAQKFGAGAGDFIANRFVTFPDRSAYILAASEFTIDLWFRWTTLPTSVTQAGQHLACHSVGISSGWAIGLDFSTPNYRMFFRNTSTFYLSSNIAAAAIAANVWHHLAYVRDNSGNPDVIRFFLDGVAYGSAALTEGASMQDNATNLLINLNCNGGSNGGIGQMDEFRLSVGKARWTAGFTPPIAAYTPDATVAGNDGYTKLLLHMDGASGSAVFTDASPALRGNGTITSIVTSATQSKFGGSAAVSSTSLGKISFADHADFELGSGDFTFDWWMYPTDLTANRTPWGKSAGIGAGEYRLLIPTSDKSMKFHIVTTNMAETTLLVQTPAAAVVVNQWAHWAVVRSGNVFTIYKDGVALASNTVSVTFADTTPAFTLFQNGNLTEWFHGYLDEFRFSKGIARWTANFTPPAGPYAANDVEDVFTQLLCHFEGQADGTTAAIIDASKNRALGTCSGGSAITTTLSKFGAGALRPTLNSAILTFPNGAWYVLGRDEFTIDFWVRMETLPTNAFGNFPGHFCGRASAVTNGWSFGIGTFTGGFKLGYRSASTYTTFPNLIASAALTVNTWHHYAFVRDNSPNPDVLRAFFDGTDLGTIALTEGEAMQEVAAIFAINNAINTAVNRGLDGISQYDEFRVSNKTRWTAPFTVPTGPYTP